MKKITKLVAILLLAAICCAVLVACGPNSNPDKAADALLTKEYTVTKDDKALLAKSVEVKLGLNRGDVVNVVTGTKTVDEETQMVFVLYFANSKIAKSVYDQSKTELDSLIKTVKIKYTGDVSALTIKRSGSLIYCGTTQAINDAK